jgi:hypothetical protein
MSDVNYDEIRDPSGVLHSLAVGKLGDTYSPSEYLREIERVRSKHPRLYDAAYPAHRAEQMRRLEHQSRHREAPAMSRLQKLEKLLGERIQLDAKVHECWQALRSERLLAIKPGRGVGELPALIGIPELERTSQLRQETVARENAAIDSSPEHRRTLANLNSAA